MAETKRWIVTTSGDRPLSDIKKDLTKTGFATGEVLDEIGIITGAAPDAIADRLRAIPGVTDVSPEGVIDIGPPDAPVTW
jgi:hypothetical protein